MENGIAASLEAVGMQAETYAKAKCPVDTGLLRNSLTHVIAPDEKAVYVGTPTEYAAYVEYGTTRQKEQPYLRPAVTEHSDEYKRIFQQYLSD